MNIAFFNATAGWGGVKTWTIDVAEELQKQGHNVVVVGKDDRFRERAASKDMRAYTVSFGADFSPVSIIKFMNFLRKEQVDAILINVSKELRTVGIAAKLLGIPIIQRIGLPKDMKCCTKVKLLDQILTPHYLFPCDHNREGMLEHLPFVDRARTTVVYTGKPVRNVSTQAHAGAVQFITTSQLNVRKGHKELMETMGLLAERGCPFHWHIVGTGTEEEALKKQCKELQLDSYITWHGWVQDIFPLLEQADCFVLPSFFEGLPNTLLEAMSCGLIPVARDVGGIHEAWPDSLKDLLIPESEPAEMWVERLKDIATLPKEDLSKNKRMVQEYTEIHFNLTKQVSKLAKELEKITEETNQ